MKNFTLILKPRRGVKGIGVTIPFRLYYKLTQDEAIELLLKIGEIDNKRPVELPKPKKKE